MREENSLPRFILFLHQVEKMIRALKLFRCGDDVAESLSKGRCFTNGIDDLVELLVFHPAPTLSGSSIKRIYKSTQYWQCITIKCMQMTPIHKINKDQTNSVMI